MRRAALRLAVNQRRRDEVTRLASLDIGEQSFQRGAVAEFDSRRILAFGLIEIARQRDARMAGVSRAGDPMLRPPQHVSDRNGRIRGERNERRIGAIFQQAADQIGQQIGVAADRRVNAAHHIRQIVAQRVVQRLAHAVQALKFVAVNAAGIFDDAGNSQRIVGRKLRIKPRPRRQQAPPAIEIAQVGHRLAREDRIVGKPPLLRALDLGVPVRALDEPHHETAVERVRHIRHPVDHRVGTLLVSLHGETEAVPSRQRSVAHDCGDHLE